MDSSKVNLNQRECRVIRDMIIFLEYQPGQVLEESELVEEFGCSRTPIREAFIRLSEEGLVHIIPKSDTYVSEVNYNDLKENFKVRKYLAKLVGELAALNTGGDIRAKPTIGATLDLSKPNIRR